MKEKGLIKKSIPKQYKFQIIFFLDDDVVGFKLKKHGSQRSTESNEKILRKQKMLAARAERLKSTNDEFKLNAETEEITKQTTFENTETEEKVYIFH